MNTVLSVEVVSKSFASGTSLPFLGSRRPRIQALRDISFSVPEGRIVGILGPNGAGKTTLLKIISTLLLADSGRVRIFDSEAGRDDENIKPRIGFVASQEKGFYQRLTGRQNLEFFASLYGLSGRRVKKRLDVLFSLFSIDYGDRRFDTYSAGMKQKFGLMRGLIHDPQLLLLDEPAKSLDSSSAQSLRRFLKEGCAGQEKKTILFSTHQMNEAQEFADGFIILHQGKIQAQGTLEELRRATGKSGAGLSDIFAWLTRAQ